MTGDQYTDLIEGCRALTRLAIQLEHYVQDRHFITGQLDHAQAYQVLDAIKEPLVAAASREAVTRSAWIESHNRRVRESALQEGSK